LLVGYAGYYICRSDLAVAAPLLTDPLTGAGLDKEALGLIASAGVFVYALGKGFSGILCDFVGGRTMFLLGMVGSVVCTLLFGVGVGVGVLLTAWSLNRLAQSMGWLAVVKLTARWFPPQRHGMVMGVLSLSFLFGDALARGLLGGLIQLGVGWRGLFVFAAGVLAVITVISGWTLKSSPLAVGLPEPDAYGGGVYGGAANDASPHGIRDLLMPFFRSPSFWLVCILSVGLTLIRETFNLWTPTFLMESAKLSAAQAAVGSMVFPFVGGISAIVTGHVSDRVAGQNRSKILAPCLGALALALIALSRSAASAELPRTLLLITLVSFLLIGPYSLLAGVVALDLGGKKGSATAAGLVDSAGYLGAVLSGYGVAVIAQRHGWEAAFEGLAAVALVTLVVALLYWWTQTFGPVAVKEV